MQRLRSALFLLVLAACAHESAFTPAPGAARAETNPPEPHPIAAAPSAASDDQALSARFQTAPPLLTLQGDASYYSDALAGHATASGEPYLPRRFTAAHRQLPLGTVLRVTRSDGGPAIYVRVNDRGPYGRKQRILDLSRAAAEELGMMRAGVLRVRAEVVAYGPEKVR